VTEVQKARRLLDSLGATGTRIIVTGDLDDDALRRLASAPVDGYGVGTNVVTGLGVPTAGFVYKLVAVGSEGDPSSAQHPVAKRSEGKATVGSRKWAWRVPSSDGGLVDVVADRPELAPAGGRPLQERVVAAGERVEGPGSVSLDETRAFHRRVRDELPPPERLGLQRLELVGPDTP
jgi:nicotinate phosphoribosyltransferase